MIPNEYRHPPARCPNCGAKVDCATNMSRDRGGPMEAGDVTVCLDCASIAVCDKVTRTGRPVLRKPTGKEKAVFRQDPRLGQVQAAIIMQARQSGRELRDTPPVVRPAPSGTRQ